MIKNSLNIICLFLSLISYSHELHANFFTNLNDNIASIKNNDPLKIETALGLGNIVNSLTVNNGESLWTTNRNHYLAGININSKTRLSLTIPFKDPEKSRQSRVDSITQSLSLSFDITDHIKASFFNIQNKGYFLETSTDGKIYRLPDLEFKTIGINIFWLYNSKHQSIYLDPFVFGTNQDSSSWISMLGYNQTEAMHLDQTRQLPSTLSTTASADNAKIQTLSLRQLYSRNWFWREWYATTALGYGVNFDSVKENADNSLKTTTTSNVNAIFSLSGGYLTNNWGLSAFTNITQSTYKTESLNLNSNIGTTGMYLTYQF